MRIPKRLDAEISGLSIRQNFLWNTVGNFVYLIVQWFFTYLVVKLLGFSEGGVFAVAVSIGSALSALALFNMRSFQVSDISGAYSQSIYFTSRFVTSAACFLVTVLFIVVSSYDFHTSCVVLLYIVFKISEAFADVLHGTLQLADRLDYAGKSFLLRGSIELVAFTIMLIISGNLAVSLASIVLISFVLLYCYDYKKTKAFNNVHLLLSNRLALPTVVSLLKECLPVALYALVINLCTQAPRIALEAQFGSEQMGYYSSIAMPVTIIQVSANYLIAPITTPLAQMIGKNDRTSAMGLIKKISTIMIVVSLAAICSYCFVGDAVYQFVFGKSILPYTYLGVPLIICGSLTAMTWILATVLVIVRETKILVVCASLSLLVAVITIRPLLHMFNLNGASYCQSIAMLLFLVVSGLFVLAKLRGARPATE